MTSVKLYGFSEITRLIGLHGNILSRKYLIDYSDIQRPCFITSRFLKDKRPQTLLSFILKFIIYSNFLGSYTEK